MQSRRSSARSYCPVPVVSACLGSLARCSCSSTWPRYSLAWRYWRERYPQLARFVSCYRSSSWARRDLSDTSSLSCSFSLSLSLSWRRPGLPGTEEGLGGSGAVLGVGTSTPARGWEARWPRPPRTGRGARAPAPAMAAQTRPRPWRRGDLGPSTMAGHGTLGHWCGREVAPARSQPVPRREMQPVPWRGRFTGNVLEVSGPRWNGQGSEPIQDLTVYIASWLDLTANGLMGDVALSTSPLLVQDSFIEMPSLPSQVFSSACCQFENWWSLSEFY
jgi:hypothetical protein